METEIMTGLRYYLGSLKGRRLGASDVTKSGSCCRAFCGEGFPRAKGPEVFPGATAPNSELLCRGDPRSMLDRSADAVSRVAIAVATLDSFC